MYMECWMFSWMFNLFIQIVEDRLTNLRSLTFAEKNIEKNAKKTRSFQIL